LGHSFVCLAYLVCSVYFVSPVYLVTLVHARFTTDLAFVGSPPRSASASLRPDHSLKRTSPPDPWRSKRIRRACAKRGAAGKQPAPKNAVNPW